MAFDSSSLPHPFPYQGSKRHLAPSILNFFPDKIDCIIEPFCGTAAVSIASANKGLSNHYLLNDINQPLIKLWQCIFESPHELADKYENLWLKQLDDSKQFFFEVRTEFNHSNQPEHLLYLLARIVKGSVRYNNDGEFNQSADNRRLGMRPSKMRTQLIGVSSLLAKKTTLFCSDFCGIIGMATPSDLIYMDPPYQGTSQNKDNRYFKGMEFGHFVDVIEIMNKRELSFIISYDGKTGDKCHGQKLPDRLNLAHFYLSNGRSSQATFLGKNSLTQESLYISPSLQQRLHQSQLDMLGLLSAIA